MTRAEFSALQPGNVIQGMDKSVWVITDDGRDRNGFWFTIVLVMPHPRDGRQTGHTGTAVDYHYWTRYE